jgi:hypothetical protein
LPHVTHMHLLRAVHEEATRLIEQRRIPTELIPASSSLFRAFDQQYATINTQGVFPKQSANAALVIRDQLSDANRFSGQSFTTAIPALGGLYSSGSLLRRASRGSCVFMESKS